MLLHAAIRVKATAFIDETNETKQPAA